MKGKYYLFGILLVLGFLYAYKDNLFSLFETSGIRGKLENIKELESLKNLLKKDAEIAPKPFISQKKSLDTETLRVQGVFELTNMERQKAGVEKLSLNSALNLGAKNKIEDMFQKGYFEHVSPGGKGPSEVAREAGYDFLVVGENLALGGFSDDKELVNAWMESPGHRDNILRGDYKDIGIAVKRSYYNGKLVWIAVQEFGVPGSLCQKPGDDLYNEVSQISRELKSLKSELIIFKELIESHDEKNEAYKELVKKYNVLVKSYNDLVAKSGDRVDEYNDMVKKYNSCLNQYLN